MPSGFAVAKRWTSSLPFVSVPAADIGKPITYVVPYYENSAFFAAQLGRWASLPESWQELITFIVVDDGSPKRQAAEVFAASELTPRHIKLYRIKDDVRWNWLAARNIGFHHAAEGWVFVTDMDHVVPERTFLAMITGQHDPGVIYGFSRMEHTGDAIGPHPNSWFMTREMFWKVGGYDEHLSGHYGTDGDWRRRMAAVAPIHILTDVLIRYEYQGDSSTTRYERKQRVDKNVSRIVAGRRPGWKPKVLSFPYYQVGA
jgi:hypothetical protein